MINSLPFGKFLLHYSLQNVAVEFFGGNYEFGFSYMERYLIGGVVFVDEGK